MKNVLYILVIAIGMVSCLQEEPAYHKQLLQVEHLQQQGDYRLEMLESFPLKQVAPCDSALHALLYMEYCMSHDITIVSDSMVNQALQYYQQGDDRRRLARCYVAQAMNVHRQGMMTKALQLLMKADEIVLSEDVQTHYLIQQEWGLLNHDAGNNRQAIAHYLQAVNDAKAMRSGQRLMVKSLLELAKSYDVIGKKDSLNLCMRRIRSVNLAIDETMETAMQVALANSELRQHDTQKAMHRLQLSWTKDVTRESSYLLGNIYWQQGDSAQAMDMWKDASTSNDPTIAIPASEAVLLRDAGNTIVMQNLLRCYKSLPQMTSAQDLSTLESQYRVDVQRQNNYKRIILLLSLIIAILVLFIVFFVYHRRKVRFFRSKIDTINHQYLSDIEAYNQAKSEVERLQQRIAAYQEDQSRPDQWNKQEMLLHAEPVLHLHRIAARGGEAVLQDWKDLIALLHEQDEAFARKMAQYADEISQKEQYVCILIRLRFIPSEIACLIGISPQSVTNLRKRLMQKLFHQDGGARDFDAAIRSL